MPEAINVRIDHKKDEEITKRQIEILSKGFDLGIKIWNREELHRRHNY